MLNHFIIFFHNINFITLMCQADCFWYKSIVVNGYDKLTIIPYKTYPSNYYSNVVFFPLFPLIIKSLSFLTKDILLIGFILNNLLIFSSLILFYKYLINHFNDTIARFGVILIAFSPANIYFLSFYTEPLFLFLCLCSFLLLFNNKFFYTSLSGGLLSATRPSGVLFIIPFFYYYFIKNKFSWSNLLKFIFLSLLSCCGILFFITYLYFHDYDFLAFVHRQYAWGRHWIGNGSFYHNMYFAITKNPIDFIWFIISFISSIVLFKNKFIIESIFNFLLVLPNFFSSSFISTSRFVLSSFCFYLTLVILSKSSRFFRFLFLCIFIILYCNYFMQWLLHI